MATPRVDEKIKNSMRQSFEASQESHEPEENANNGEVKTFDFFLELPERTKRWFPETAGQKDSDGNEHSGEHFFDIVPFFVGSKYPTESWVNKKGRRVIDANCKEGSLFYKLDIWYHKRVGEDSLAVPCAKRNYGKPCPICEWVEEQYKKLPEGDPALKTIWSDHGPKRQCVYNVYVVNEDGEKLDEDIQVLNVADFYMEEKLRTISRPRKGGIIFYADPEEGKTVFFEKVDGGDYPEFEKHEFIERDYEISDEDISNAICLDECIKEYTYEEVKKLCKLYEGLVTSANNEEPINRATPKPRPRNKVDYSECPWGGEFGKGYDEYEDCDECDPDCKEACKKIKGMPTHDEDDVPF